VFRGFIITRKGDNKTHNNTGTPLAPWRGGGRFFRFLKVVFDESCLRVPKYIITTAVVSQTGAQESDSSN
jgi:hypothetical protein